MNRSLSCRMDGSDVVQTMTILEDDGTLHSENVIRLGNRDVVLAQVAAQAAEAKRDRDGVAAATTTRPIPASGPAGQKEVYFWIEGRNMYRSEVRRNPAGKIAHERVSNMGDKVNAIENCVARYMELADLVAKIMAAV